MNLTSILDDLLQALERPLLTSQTTQDLFIFRQHQDSTKQVLTEAFLQATLAVCEAAELGAKQRLHGLARVFSNLCHTFELATTQEVRSVADVGLLWSYAMRTFVLDPFLQVEQQHRR